MNVRLTRSGQRIFRTRVCELVLLFALALAPASAYAQVRAGALLPLTGDLSTFGQTGLAAIQLAKQHYESAFDKEIEIAIRDTEGNPQLALQYMQEMHNEGIRAFVGPFSSASVQAVQAYANENGLLVISPGSTSMALAQDDMIYRLIANEDYNIGAYLTYFKNRGFNAVALLYREDVYGTAYAGTFQSLAQEFGITILGQSGYPVTATSYSEELQSLRDTVQTGVETYGAEKTAVLAISFDELGSIMKEAYQIDGLSQVQWFASESSDHLTEFSEDESVAAFAAQTKFTFASVSNQHIYHPRYPHNHEYSLALAQIEEIMGSAPHKDMAGYFYDAFCLAVHAERFADSLGGLKPAVEYAAQSLLGLSLYVFFDEHGDRANGILCFNRFALTGEGYKWILAASYSKDVSGFGVYDSFYYYEYDLDDSDQTITIGALLSLSGSNATIGKSIKKTLEYVKQDIAAYLKREFSENSEINIVITDTASDPQTALTQIKELHEQGINMFIGPLTSAELSEVADYVNENQIFLLSPSSTSLDLAQDDTIFRFALDNGKLAYAAAVFMQEEEIEFVQPVYRNDIYGVDAFQAFKENAESLGLVCGEGIAYDPGTLDFTDTVSELEEKVNSAAATYSSGKTCALIISMDEGIGLFNAIPQQSPLREIRWLGSDGLLLNSTVINDPGARQFALETGFTAFGPGNISYMPLDIYGQSIRDSLSDFIGEQPGTYDYLAHDAAWQLTLFSLKQTFPGMEDTDRKELFVDMASSVKVGFQIYDLNQFGDSNFGYCEFYTVAPDGQNPVWVHTAKYTYHLLYEGLEYLQSTPGTPVDEWSIY